MAELVDAQDLGSCGLAVGVRVPPPACQLAVKNKAGQRVSCPALLFLLPHDRQSGCMKSSGCVDRSMFMTGKKHAFEYASA